MTLFDSSGNPINPGPARLAVPEGTELPKTRILIAVPAQDEVKTGFWMDSLALVGATVKNRPDLELAITAERGTNLADQRHSLAMRGILSEADYILWLDSDMRFPKHALVRLLSHKLPIVAANYVTRRMPPEPVSFVDDHDKTKRVPTNTDSIGLAEVAATGMGLMLTAVEVFKKIPMPWFGLHWVAKDQGFASEDVWFCRTAREHGFKVFIDHELSKEVRHLGELEYSNEMMEA